MATDVEILTARANYAAALAAVDAAKANHVRITNEQTEAARRLEELKARKADAERRLLVLAAQKPAEPAPRVEVKADPPPPRPSVPAPEPALLPAVPGPVPTLSGKRQRG